MPLPSIPDFRLLLSLVCLSSLAFGQSGYERAEVKAAFRGDCEVVLLKTIKKARREILVAAYAFSRHAIAEALIESVERGVKVQVKMDETQANGEFGKPVVNRLRRAEIEVQLIKMPSYKHMHNKFIVVDGRYVVTGSYNFSTAATTANWENVVLIESRGIAEAFSKEWERIDDFKED